MTVATSDFKMSLFMFPQDERTISVCLVDLQMPCTD